eukprot:Em0136g7a
MAAGWNSICDMFAQAVKIHMPEMLQKHKVHPFLHIIPCMLQFGPTSEFCAERCESFNASVNVYGNHKSPSRDIAINFAHLQWHKWRADPEKKKASVRDTYNANAVSKRAAKRQRYQEDLEENRAAKRQRYQEGVEENRAAKRQRYQEGVEENRAAKVSDIERPSRRTVLLKGGYTGAIQLPLRQLEGVGIGRELLPLPPKAVFNVKEGVEEKLKGSDIKRASRRTVLLIGGYTGAIQLPLRQLEGVGIGRVVELPLPPKAAELPPPPPPAAESCPHRQQQQSYPRGSGIAVVTELPLPPKVAAELPPPPPAVAAELPPPPPAVAAELPPPPPAVAAELPPTPPAVAAELPPPAEAGALLPAPAPTTGTSSIDTSAPTTTSPAAPLAAATTTHMAPMARIRPPRP